MANPHSDLGNSPRFALILITIVRFVCSATALLWLWYATVGLVAIHFFLSHDVRFFERYSPPKSHRRLTTLDPDIISKSVMSSCKFCSTSDLLRIARAITNLEKSSIRVTMYLLLGVLCRKWPKDGQTSITTPGQQDPNQGCRGTFALGCVCLCTLLTLIVRCTERDWCFWYLGKCGEREVSVPLMPFHICYHCLLLIRLFYPM